MDGNLGRSRITNEDRQKSLQELSPLRTQAQRATGLPSPARLGEASSYWSMSSTQAGEALLALFSDYLREVEHQG